MGILFNLSMPQFPHLYNRGNDSPYFVIENGVTVRTEWENTGEVPSIVSGMPGVPNKCQVWLHVLFIDVLPLEVSHVNWVVWLTAHSLRSSLPQRPCMTLSGWERFLHNGLRVSFAYPQHSTCLLAGVIVVFSYLWCWIPQGQDLSLVICVPRGWAESDTEQTLGAMCFSENRKDK